MEKLKVELARKIAKLDKFRRHPIYPLDICIDGTGFTYHVFTDTWWKLRTYPLPDHFRIQAERHLLSEPSSMDEVLETVSDDIRDTILFNINLFR